MHRPVVSHASATRRPQLTYDGYALRRCRCNGPTMAPNRRMRDVCADASARRLLLTVVCDVGAGVSARCWLLNIARDVGCRCIGSALFPNVNTSCDGVRPPADVVRLMYDQERRQKIIKGTRLVFFINYRGQIRKFCRFGPFVWSK